MDSQEKIDFSPGSLTRLSIAEEFRLPKWEPFRKWFFENFSKTDKKEMQEKFYNHLSQVNKIIYFVPWFIHNYLIDYISVLERDYKLINGEIVKQIFPPQQPFFINKEDIHMHFSAFQKLLENDTLTITTSHVNQLIQQQNFANIYLIVLGEQIFSIHKRVETILNQIDQLKNKKINENNKNEASCSKAVASIQPPPEIEDFKLKSTIELERIIENQLKGLKLSTINDEISDDEYKNQIYNNINKMERYNSKYANKPSQKLYYYPRPSPQDVLHEEEEYVINNSYSGKNIYEWNIDGYTERQIYNLVHRMMMYSTIAKANHNEDKTVANMIVAGFTGQLKGWWDNYLTSQDKQTILDTIKTENGEQKTNAVYTLIVNIIEHFTGRWSDNSENIRTLLNGLKCPTLTSFRWYKDTFLSRVMELPDSNTTHWKSKFIDGLPNLFAERIRNTLRKDDVNINYDNYTYGKLIGTCIQEGLALCNEIKLNQQIKFQNLNERRQLGQFCDQFGMDCSNSLNKKFYKNSKRKDYSKNRNSYKIEKRKDKRFIRKQFRKNKSTITCYKCGKIGHFANKCRVKKKINSLNIDEEMKDSLKKILLNSESENENSFDDSESLESEKEINCNCLKEEDFVSENEDSDENTDIDIYKIQAQFEDLKINVITNEILDLLKLIKDDNIRNKIIEQFDNEKSQDNTPYSMVEVNKMLQQRQKINTPVTLDNLLQEVNNIKKEIDNLKNKNKSFDKRISNLEKGKYIETNIEEEDNNFLQTLEMVTSQKWWTKVTLIINNTEIKEFTALVDSGADLNCVKEGLIPTKYFIKTSHSVGTVSGEKMRINYKLQNAKICKNGVCIPTNFILVKNMTNQMILGNPFLDKIFPLKRIDKEGIIGTFNGKNITFEFITQPVTKMLSELRDQIITKNKQIGFLKDEINMITIEEKLENPKLKGKILMIINKFSLKICNDHPNAFWDRKKHIVSLPYEEEFSESNIPTKARPCQMNSEYLELCKKEIASLLQKGLIKPSKSQWSCTAFYVNKHAEQERGVPRLVINYKPLNKVLKWIRYPIPNKKDLLDRLHNAVIFSKFDLKSGYWQIQINEQDRYKTAFNVPFGQYEWNVMPFGLKNAPSEFQNIMNDIFNPFSNFIIVYIDDILVFSKDIESHFKHLEIFEKIIIDNGLVISKPKMMLFQTKIRFLGHNIEKGQIIPINRSIEFASKFPDVILDKTQLQRFLGSLNYISAFYKDLSKDTAILYDRLKKTPSPWTESHTQAVQKIKTKVASLPCLSLANPNWAKIIETDASEIGYGGILKQVNPENKQEILVRFHSGKWNNAQKNYATVAKEILSIIKCVLKFQEDLYNQPFIIKTDCQAAKYMFNKDFKHDVSKQMYARWQAQLAPFDFTIEYKKGKDNILPDFLTREFIQS